MRAIRQLLSWFLAAFLIVILLHWTIHPWPEPQTGNVIFYDLPGEHVIFSTLAENSGFALFEPTLRLAFGMIEVLAMLLLLVPPLRKAGAWLTSVCCVLLIVAHVSPWLGIELPEAGAPSQTDAGSAFYLTVACLTASLLLLAVHPSKRR